MAQEKQTMRWYCDRDGINYITASKRRLIAGVGLKIGGRLWLLTEREWKKVKVTPLYGCTGIRGK